jgi:putative colanic acid biosynthesis UDP-glucose lipid carrier transferase
VYELVHAPGGLLVQQWRDIWRVQMIQPIIFSRSFSIALVSLMQVIAPPVVAVSCLCAAVWAYGSHFDDSFVVLAVLVGALTAVGVQPPRSEPTELLPQRLPLAIGIIGRWIVLLGMLATIAYLTKFPIYPRRIVVAWALTTPALLLLTVLSLQELMRRLLFAAASARRVVFAGCNEISQSLANRLTGKSDLRMSVAGFFDDRSAERLGVEQPVTMLGSLRDLPEYVRTHSIDTIFVALPMRHIQRVADLLDGLRDTTASIYYVPDVFVFDLIQARTGEIMGIPVVALCETPFYGYRGVVKRLTDIAISAAILVLGMPIILSIALLVKATSSGPVIFKQRRYGLDGREITVYKFRTMTVSEDGPRIRQVTKSDNRVTALGRILRRYSLDELPQLINVLQGRMSLVGPRPHAVAHNEQYRKLIKGYMVRHKVLPGITGLAQINGCRGETSQLEDMQARVNLDIEYLRRWTPMLDLQILSVTILKIFRDDEAY